MGRLPFFERLAEACGASPDDIAYVGDRLDNDVLAAEAAGMTGVFLRRGLWARAHGNAFDAVEVRHTIDTLADLPMTLGL